MCVMRTILLLTSSFLMSCTPALSNGVLVEHVHRIAAIPGGRYALGCALSICADNPPHQVDLNPFSMDVYPVLLVDYQLCVRRRQCDRMPHNQDSAHDGLEVAVVSYSDAENYCRFVRGHLPTPSEWEVAARGGKNWIFPWGNEYERRKLACRGSIKLSQDTFYSYVRVCGAESGQSPFGVRELVGYPEFVGSSAERPQVRGGTLTDFNAPNSPENVTAVKIEWADSDSVASFRCAYSRTQTRTNRDQ